MGDVNEVVLPVAARLPRIPEQRAAVLQALFRQPRRWPVEGGGTLAFGPGDAPPPEETFAIDSDGARLALALDPREGTVPEGLHWAEHSGRSRVLAWSLAQEARLVRLSQALGMTLVPAVAGGDDPVAEVTAGEGAWLRFRVGAQPGGDDDPGGMLWLPLSRLQALLARAEAVDEAGLEDALAPWRALPAPVTVRMDGPRVPRAEWARLVPGAVIVAGRVSAPPPVRARAAGLAWPVEQGPRGWCVTGPGVPGSEDQETTMSDDEQQVANEAAQAGEASGTPVGSLPVLVQFELGRLEVALSDLAQLQPGYVFALPANLEGANVAIRANGREVGRGELVAVGDTLGVRLRSWS